MTNKNSSLPKYRGLVSLIPGGTLQFLDLGINLSKLKRLSSEYYEYVRSQDASGKDIWALRCLVMDDEKNCYVDKQTGDYFVDPATGLEDIGIQPTYGVSLEKALEPFLGQWVPLPFFRAEQNFGSSDFRFKAGPTDWARGCVTELLEPDAEGNTHRLTIAFDTHIQPGIDVANVDPTVGYPALSESDMRDGGEFSFVSDIKYNAWFLALDWMTDWLQDFFNEAMKKKRPGRVIKESDYPNRAEYLARYISFLELLEKAGVIPKIRIVDPERHQAIDVDLVLDIGNSRTIGMLIERRPGETLSLSNGSILEMRDLSDPRLIHKNTFDSYVAFAKANFGDQNGFSRGSGRFKSSFSWPSVVRVGPEARRLAVSSRREEGQTSMSSPKRYLWDLKPRLQEWRYCPLTDSEFSEEPPVNSGDFVGFINDEGLPLHAFSDSKYRNLDILVGKSNFPVTEPKFSRSSLMLFLLSEIISHTLVQINSPAERGNRLNSDIPRKLRRIILTVPPAMSVSERKIFKRWANWAVDVLWEALDWKAYEGVADDYRQKPDIKINLDEASTTQLVFVYNEIAEKFAGDTTGYFKTFGKVRQNSGNGHSLRVASIDIGGGTTDMIITTYLNESAGATNIIVPRQEFREGFNVAGDDLLKVVIENHVLPNLIQALSKTGLRQPKEDLMRKLKNAIGLSEKDRNLRAQFAQQILTPIGLQILQLSEQLSVADAQSTVLTFGFSELFQNQLKPHQSVLDFIEELSDSSIEQPFKFDQWVIEVDMAAVIISINSMIGPYLKDLGEVIRIWDCDYLVLSGRPSCLPAVQANFFKNPPVKPSRIVPMSEYQIESWYPFWTPEGKIDDPKTTGVVGALLCAISEGNLGNFHFRTIDLHPASTIKFIGEMSLDKQIKNEHLFFNHVDLDSARDEDMQGSFKFAAPVYIGFRQLLAERWKATPFYYVSFSGQQAQDRAQKLLPYEIKFSYQRRFDDEVEGGVHPENEGVLKIEEVIGNDGTTIPRTDIELQLKSLWEASGHWLDTGLFEIR